METQKSISDWAEATFGKVGSNLSVLARANVEVAELLMKAVVGESTIEGICEECADVAICLYRFRERCKMPPPARTQTQVWAVMEATISVQSVMVHMMDLLSLDDLAVSDGMISKVFEHLHGIVGMISVSSLDVFVDRKMAKNRVRKWVVRGGHGQHVEPASDADHRSRAFGGSLNKEP